MRSRAVAIGAALVVASGLALVGVGTANNVSRHGNARDFADTAHGNFDGATFGRMRMDVIERYAHRALDLAPDAETKARAVFLLARADQGRRYASSDDDGTTGSPTWFGVLQERYANTRYYQEVVRECGYFRRYLGR